MSGEEKFQIEPESTGVALGYTNKKLIADKIFPNVPVAQESFKHLVYKDILKSSIPETRIGDKGEANMMEFGSEKVTSSVENHSLKDMIPKTKIVSAAKQGTDIKAIMTMQLVNSLKTAREVDLSKKLSDVNNYLTGNTYNLGKDEKLGSDKSMAVDMIEEYKGKVLGGANTMVLSERAFSKLRRDKSVIKSLTLNKGVSESEISAMITFEAIKELFLFENIFIGQSKMNGAKKGQNASIKSCWEDDIILLNIDPLATTDYGITYGYSAVYKDYTVGTYFDEDKGLEGCEIIRPYASYIDLICCPACGALLKGVV